MYKILILLAVLGWIGDSAADASIELRDGQVQIALRSDSAVASSQVMLGDVAVLHTRELSAIQRLVSLPLGRAPAVGTESVLARPAIERWIRSQFGMTREQLVWSGPEEAHVRTLAQELPAAQLQRLAEAALRDWLGQRTSRYELQAVAPPRDLKLPAGLVELHVRPFPANAEPAQRTVVWVDVLVNASLVRAVPVSFRLDAFRDAWVAPAGLASGVNLAPSMVEKRELKLTGRPQREDFPVAQSQDGPIFKGWHTTKPVEAGEPITLRNVGPAALVARGEWVLLRLNSGLVQLERRAQVMQDGKLGQVVKVRSSNGLEPISARVMGAGQVEATL